MSTPDYKRIILVTGANTGIGLGIVRNLAKLGHRVYLGARDEQKGREATDALVKDGLDVKFVQIVVNSQESVTAAKDLIEKAEGRLDSLVNNAGVALLRESTGALSEPLDNIKITMETNFYGVVLVCQAFVPLLLRAKEGYACIVNVGMIMGSTHFVASKPLTPYDKWIAYNTSKAAVNSYTVALAKELEGKVKVNSVTPGFVTTQLNGNMPGGKSGDEGGAIIAPWALLGPDDKRTKLFANEDGSIIEW